jgi:prepilin-type N-terminal cleavage/methylation domain-containing protein
MFTRYLASFYPRFRSMAKRGMSRQGFTLIELLMAIMVSAILLIIMTKFLADFHESREWSRVMTELQEQGQFALDYMTYGSDYATYGAGTKDTIRREGIIWASHIDISPDKKKISFQGPNITGTISYEESTDKLSKSPGPENIIPYLDGSKEYLHGPFKVCVNFDTSGKAVLISVTVSKDGLSSTLKSAVTPRNG